MTLLSCGMAGPCPIPEIIRTQLKPNQSTAKSQQQLEDKRRLIRTLNISLE